MLYVCSKQGEHKLITIHNDKQIHIKNKYQQPENQTYIVFLDAAA